MASDTGCVYALDDGGKPKWQAFLGSPVLAMTRSEVLPEAGECVVVGQRDGSVVVLGRTGEVLARCEVSAAVKLVYCADLDGDGADEVIAVDDEGLCVVLGR